MRTGMPSRNLRIQELRERLSRNLIRRLKELEDMFPSALKAEFGLRVDVSSAIEETIDELKMVRLTLEKRMPDRRLT